MTPPIKHSEFRTEERCEEILSAKANTAKWICGIVMGIFLTFVGIWARAAMINASAEMIQEVSIGQLKTEVKSTTIRLERIENKLDQAITMMHKKTTP